MGVVLEDYEGGGRGRDVLEGGEGGWLGPPSSRVPLWSPPQAGQKFLSLNRLDTEGAEADFGGQPQHWKRRGGGTPLLLRCTAVLIHHWGGGQFNQGNPLGATWLSGTSCPNSQAIQQIGVPAPEPSTWRTSRWLGLGALCALQEIRMSSLHPLHCHCYPLFHTLWQ